MLSRVLSAAALLALPATAQQVLFFEDFEAGLGNWTAMSGFQLEDSSTGCFAAIAPFPSGTKAAYYGNPQSCTFFNLSTGTLDQNVAVSLPASAEAAWLQFQSYEEGECSICKYDRRLVYVSADGGPWTLVGEGDLVFEWNEWNVDLTPYLGSDVRIRFEFDAFDGFANDFLGWVIDDVRIVATDPPVTYCTGKTNSLGCVPFLTTTGTPSASSTSPFRIVVNDTIGEVGRVWYSFKKGNLNFHGAKLCIKAPLKRLTNKAPKKTGTPPCEWTLSRNFNARIQSGVDPQLTPGQTVFAQWRGRDTNEPQGFGTMITNGVKFALTP